MGPAPGPAGSEEPLQEWPAEGKGHLETGGEPDPHRNCRRCSPLWRPKLPSPEPGPVAGSDTEGNATISLRPKGTGPAAFVLRYKGRFDHWIGLRRDPGQLWKWASGTKFNNLFPIGGDCTYLNGVSAVSSLRCSSERH
ncbi:unnamed protein product [Lepidochelys olivacea]